MIELKLKRGLTWASLFCANLCTGTCTCMAVKNREANQKYVTMNPSEKSKFA